MGGIFIQDRWRVRPNLTVNYGFRWELQGDMYNVNGIVAIPDQAAIYGPSNSLFTPGSLSNNTDPLLKIGQHAFGSDLANPGGNIGIAWNPRPSDGILKKLMGDGKTVLRGSYSLVYYDEGSQMFAATVGNNPGGKTQTSTFTAGQGGVPFNLTLQNILSNGLPPYTNISPASFQTTLHATDLTFVNNYQAMKPTLRAPYTINWNFGIQRELARNTVLQVNYVGNTSHHGWRQSNLNEINIFENGFLNGRFIHAAKQSEGQRRQWLRGRLLEPRFRRRCRASHHGDCLRSPRRRSRHGSRARLRQSNVCHLSAKWRGGRDGVFHGHQLRCDMPDVWQQLRALRTNWRLQRSRTLPHQFLDVQPVLHRRRE